MKVTRSRLIGWFDLINFVFSYRVGSKEIKRQFVFFSLKIPRFKQDGRLVGKAWLILKARGRPVQRFNWQTQFEGVNVCKSKRSKRILKKRVMKLKTKCSPESLGWVLASVLVYELAFDSMVGRSSELFCAPRSSHKHSSMSDKAYGFSFGLKKMKKKMKFKDRQGMARFLNAWKNKFPFNQIMILSF